MVILLLSSFVAVSMCVHACARACMHVFEVLLMMNLRGYVGDSPATLFAIVRPPASIVSILVFVFRSAFSNFQLDPNLVK